MTSTGFNIGLSSEKNSSRVLRPPGGGHTDIFGVRDNQNELVTPSKRRNHPKSTISSCFTMVDEPKLDTNENGNSNEQEVIKEEEKNEVDNGADENKAPGEDENKAPGEDEKKKQSEKQEETVTVPKRGRVPPGGFSSGLW